MFRNITFQRFWLGVRLFRLTLTHKPTGLDHDIHFLCAPSWIRKFNYVIYFPLYKALYLHNISMTISIGT